MIKMPAKENVASSTELTKHASGIVIILTAYLTSLCLLLVFLYSSEDYFLATDVTYDQIPLSSANEDLQPVLAAKRRILALNKKDLANPNIMNVSIYLVWSASSGWKHYLLLKHSSGSY